MTKEQEFAEAMRAYSPEVYGDMSAEELCETSRTLRMAVRLQVPGTISTIVPMAIVMDIWGDMLQPMNRKEFAARVECEAEFGHHTDHEDCAWLLDEMSGRSVIAYMDGERDAYNRETEEVMLGRPLFPNEY